jgi:SAM-dependent methyltransferase
MYFRPIMALEHHSNHQLRFDQQVDNSENYVLPFIASTLTIRPNLRVLEIGCGEGGVLKPFVQRGCECLGVDLDQVRIDLAQEFLKDEIASGKLKVIYKNVFDDDFKQAYANYFELIILKDVIEHIHNQEAFIPFLKTLLVPGGQVFFGFPPWQMPFGGHQQIAHQKLTSKLPYYHLLPMPLYKKVLAWGGESSDIIDQLVEIKETGISIERFERICTQNNFEIVNRQWFLINPIYKFKFGLTPRKQVPLLGAIPGLRNLLTTCAYYSIQKS